MRRHPLYKPTPDDLEQRRILADEFRTDMRADLEREKASMGVGVAGQIDDEKARLEQEKTMRKEAQRRAIQSLLR